MCYDMFYLGCDMVTFSDMICGQLTDYTVNASGARRAKKRTAMESSSGDGQSSLRSSGRQVNVRMKRCNNPPPGQVYVHPTIRQNRLHTVALGQTRAGRSSIVPELGTILDLSALASLGLCGVVRPPFFRHSHSLYPLPSSQLY